MTRPIGLYLHVPFCRQRCDFCAFYLEVYREKTAASFIEALKQEIHLYAEQRLLEGRVLQSVYFGGGTPTAVGSTRLVDLLDHVRNHFSWAHDCEITVEAHPASMNPSDYQLLRQAGVTRLSLGAESMLDEELIRLGRPGLVEDTVRAVMDAKRAGFSNINLDVMYGLPGQTLASWRNTLDYCLALGPAHLSCYALTVEEGTALAKQIELQRCPAPDESLQVEMDALAEEQLSQAGYERYEVSNYAKAGFACRHNLLYWTGGDYLGVGPSAQSLVNHTRFGNVADLGAYQSALAAGRSPIEERTDLTEAERLRDTVLFGFRLLQGIPTERLYRHGKNYGYEATIDTLQADGLIEETAGRVKLTRQGLLHADRVAERLY